MYALLAEAFTYPRPGLLERLEGEAQSLPRGPAQKAFARFLEKIKKLSPEAWEELYTATLDMNPKLVPYIGYVVWGDSYRRGDFMAALKRAMEEAGVDLAGELPDHLVPVLRYLDRSPAPMKELLEVLEPALVRIKKDLEAFDRQNPYLHLVEALLVSLPKVERRKA